MQKVLPMCTTAKNTVEKDRHQTNIYVFTTNVRNELGMNPKCTLPSGQDSFICEMS